MSSTQASVNRVTLLGGVTGIPIVGTSSGGAPQVELEVSTDEMWKDKKTGRRQYRQECHQVVFHGKAAEKAATLAKGARVYIEGRVRSVRRAVTRDASACSILGGKLEIISTPDAQRAVACTRAISDHQRIPPTTVGKK